MNNFLELCRQRQSCRDFSDVPVERGKLMYCMEAAQLAPSACNAQPWRFLVVTETQLARQVAKCLQGDGSMNSFTEHCPAFIILLLEKGNQAARRFGELKKRNYGHTDLGIAAAHICLAAEAQGLGSCIIGFLDEDGLRGLLGLEEPDYPFLAVAIGYPKSSESRQKSRKAIEDIVRFFE